MSCCRLLQNLYPSAGEAYAGHRCPSVHPGTGDIPGCPIVRQDHPVFFQGIENNLCLGGISGCIERRFQPEPLPHRRIGGIGDGGGIVAGRPDICLPGRRGGEPQGMPNLPGCDFIIPHQTRQDGKTGSICRSPACRPQRIGREIKDRTGACCPGPISLSFRVEKFVEHLCIAVDDQHMTV